MCTIWSAWEVLLPPMLEWREGTKAAFISAFRPSHDAHHAEIVDCMQEVRAPTFVQVNYGLGSRAGRADRAEDPRSNAAWPWSPIFPLGGRGGRNLQAVQDRPLPDWATDSGCTSWVQVMLKYAFLSHPAVTCVISGSTKAAHIDDNQQAGRGVLPDGRAAPIAWNSIGTR